MTSYDPEHFLGYPGMVWYAKVTPTRGDELKVGDALDSLDHRGARTIHGVHVAAGRDPVGKAITEQMIAAHPDWSDQQVAARINVQLGEPVITVGEVAHWRAEVAR